MQANAEPIFPSIRAIRNPLEYYRDLICALLAKEFKVRYKSTVLGYAWSVLHPLMFTLVFLFLFKVVLRVQIENHTLFLMAGVFTAIFAAGRRTARSWIGSA